MERYLILSKVFTLSIVLNKKIKNKINKKGIQITQITRILALVNNVIQQCIYISNFYVKEFL